MRETPLYGLKAPNANWDLGTQEASRGSFIVSQPSDM